MTKVKIVGAEFLAEEVASQKEADFIAFATEQMGLAKDAAKAIHKEATNLCKPMKMAPAEQPGKAAE